MVQIQKKIRHILKWARSFLLYRFLWRKKFAYNHDPKVIDAGWNMVQTYGTFQCPIKLLWAAIATKTGKRLVPIEQTPHYKYVRSLIKGDGDNAGRETYRQYMETFYGHRDSDSELHRIAKLVTSIECESDFDSLITIVTYPPKLQRASGVYKVRIYDGIHRVAIAKVRGYESIQCRLR